jgi:hypothetical protein
VVLEDTFFTAGSGLNDLPVESYRCMAIGADGSVAVAGATIRGSLYDEADFTTVLFANLAPSSPSPGVILSRLRRPLPTRILAHPPWIRRNGNLTPVITLNTVMPNVPGSYSVTWSATDIQGTTGTATRSVTVGDTTAPTVVGPVDVVVETLDPNRSECHV